MSVKNKQKLPKWFNGTLYSQGETVANPFTGEEIELTNVELSLYDFIMGCNMLFDEELRGSTRVNDDIIRDFDRALTWFRVNNPQAYMVLLD